MEQFVLKLRFYIRESYLPVKFPPPPHYNFFFIVMGLPIKRKTVIKTDFVQVDLQVNPGR